MSEVSRVITHPKIKLGGHDIVMVIPCYNEGKGVLDTLHSIATEAAKVESKIAVFLVINNPSVCDEHIIEENKKTARLIIDILRNQKLEDKKTTPYSGEEIKQISEIRASHINIGLVDCYSQRNAPEICNVGYARDIGTRSILPFLRNDCSVISHTDADCKVLSGYFTGIEDGFFFWEDDIQISTGERLFISEKNNEEVREQYLWIDEIELYLEYISRKNSNNSGTRERKTHFTPGSHMQFTKGLFKELGGFERIGGAEDVTFGMAAQRLGYTIHEITSRISTLCRLSDRTENGHGFGFEMIRKGTGNKADTPVNTFEYYSTLHSCIEVLENCHQSNDFRNTLFHSPMNEIFPIETLNTFAHIYEKYTWGNTMRDFHITGVLPYLLVTVKLKLHDIYPRKPLHEVISMVNTMIDEDEILKEFSKIIELPPLDTMKRKKPRKSENDTALQPYCEYGKERIYTYILLRKVVDFADLLSLAYQDFKEKSTKQDTQIGDGDKSIDEIRDEIILFIKAYWNKISSNFLIEAIGEEKSQELIKEVNKVYFTWDIDGYIKDLDNINDILQELNKRYGCAFPVLQHYFQIKDFLRKYNLGD